MATTTPIDSVVYTVGGETVTGRLLSNTFLSERIDSLGPTIPIGGGGARTLRDPVSKTPAITTYESVEGAVSGMGDIYIDRSWVSQQINQAIDESEQLMQQFSDTDFYNDGTGFQYNPQWWTPVSCAQQDRLVEGGAGWGRGGHAISYTASDGVCLDSYNFCLYLDDPGSALVVTADKVKVRVDTTCALKIDNTLGLQLNIAGVSGGVCITANALCVAVNNACSVYNSASGIGISLCTNSGLSHTGGKLTLNACGDCGGAVSANGLYAKVCGTAGTYYYSGNIGVCVCGSCGLAIDSSTGLYVKVCDYCGLIFISGALGLRVCANAGLTMHSTDGLQVKLATTPGLQFDGANGVKLLVPALDNTNRLCLDATGVHHTTAGGATHIVGGTGCTITKVSYDDAGHIVEVCGRSDT